MGKLRRAIIDGDAEKVEQLLPLHFQEKIGIGSIANNFSGKGIRLIIKKINAITEKMEPSQEKMHLDFYTVDLNNVWQKFYKNRESLQSMTMNALQFAIVMASISHKFEENKKILDTIIHFYQSSPQKDMLFSQKDSNGWNAMHYVGFYLSNNQWGYWYPLKEKILVKLLNESSDINAKDNGGESFIFRIAERMDVIEKILNYKHPNTMEFVEFDYKNNYGVSFLEILKAFPDGGTRISMIETALLHRELKHKNLAPISKPKIKL